MDDPSDHDLWALNPALRTVPVGGAGVGDSVLLELDDRHGRTLRMSVSSDVMRLLDGFRHGRTWAEYRRTLESEGHDAQQLDAIARFLLGPCRDKHVLVAPDTVQPASDQPARPPYLNLMIPLLSPRIVNALSARLHPLFSRGALIGGLIAIGAAMFAMFVAMQALPNAPALDASGVLAVGGIAAIGILLHELGHAAAAYRLGARRVSIGVGLYLVIPIAYSELSELWRYPRRSRIVVNCAGVYMQGLVLVALMTLYFGLDDPTWLVAAGYWIVADALGIHDLRRRAVEALRIACARVLGRTPTPGVGSPALLLYAALSALFLTWMLYRALAFLFDAALVSLPQAYARLQTLSLADLSASEAVLGTIVAAWQVLFAVVAVRFVGGVPRRLRRWWRHGRYAAS